MSEQEKDLNLAPKNTEAKTSMRQVRSFVRREGRSSSKQIRVLDQLWPKYGVEYDTQLLDLNQLFMHSPNNINNPITLEIGFGMGASLIETIQAQPETNFIGIEVHRPGVGTFLNNANTNSLKNIKVLQHDAVEVLENMIPNTSLDKVQIFFPDPWPKKKHHKRRIVQHEFINIITQKLKLNGILHLATDWQNYAEHMLEILENTKNLINHSGKNHYSPRPKDRPLTKYEQRGQKLGHGVWDLIFTKSE